MEVSKLLLCCTGLRHFQQLALGWMNTKNALSWIWVSELCTECMWYDGFQDKPQFGYVAVLFTKE